MLMHKGDTDFPKI